MKSLSPLLLGGLLIAHTAFAHELEDSQKPLVTTGLSVALSYSYRNKNYNEKDSEWQVPGTLMGGEALPVEEDAALDDATADYQYAFSPNAGIQITAEAHGGHGETEFNTGIFNNGILTTLPFAWKPDKWPPHFLRKLTGTPASTNTVKPA
jgi:hypothetical protein